MIHLSGQLICTDDQQAATVRAHLPDHIRLTLAEPGSLKFTVTQTADPLIWQVDESFTDQTAFDDHQARTRASKWYKATAQIARAFHIRNE